jgi:hypothetical protein
MPLFQKHNFTIFHGETKLMGICIEKVFVAIFIPKAGEEEYLI